MQRNDRRTEQLCARIHAQRERLYRLAYSYVKNEQDAMDVVQDAACKLLRHAERVESPQYFDTWIYRVTVNTALDFLRKRKRETVGLPECDEGAPDDYSRLYVTELLDRLDEKSRAVVILRFFEDRTLREIGEILNESLSTVKYRLYHSLKTLRLYTEEDEYDREG